MKLDLARVLDIHPESNSVDLELMDDGRKMAGVTCMSPLAGTDFGSAGLAPAENGGYGSKKSQSREIIAIVSWVNQLPIVLGFIFPQVSQCLFMEKGRWVYRHPSDAYFTIDSKGNAEFYHPSGAFVRLGESGGHEDLTGKDYDGKWKITRNTSRKVNIHVEQSGGTASLNVAPDGSIVVNSKSTVTVNADGETTIKAPHVTVDTPEAHFTGNVVADGTITDLSGSGGRSMDSMRSVFNAHDHSDPQGGKVQPPAVEM
jgi:phage gp45-like